MTGKIIIFDFDGVLADTFDTFYPLIKAAMKSIGFSITPDQYRDFFIGNVHQSFKDFIGDNKKYEIFTEFRNTNYNTYYNGKLNKAKLFPGAINFLEKIHRAHILTINSSGRKANIQKLLEENGVKNLFDLVLADSTTSKEGMLKETLTKFGADPKKSIMITDTIGDVIVAKKIGLKTIAVTWGFQSKEMLKKSNPDLLVTSYDELLTKLT